MSDGSTPGPSLRRRRLLRLTGVAATGALGSGVATGGRDTDTRPDASKRFSVIQDGTTYTVSPLGDGRTVEQHYDPPKTHDEMEPDRRDRHRHISASPYNRPDTNRMYFWDGPEGISLVVLNDGEFDDDGGVTVLTFDGMPDGAWVAQNGPFNANHRDEASAERVYWNWIAKNTDGGAYRGAFESAEVTITPDFRGGIDAWQFLSAPPVPSRRPRVVSLDPTTPITILGPERRAEEVALDVYPREIVTDAPLTVLSGFPWPPLEFRYENLAGEVVSGIDVEMSVGDDGLSVTGTSAPDGLGPGEVHDDTVDVDPGVAPTATGEHPVAVSLSGEDVETTDRRFTATVDPTVTATVEPAVPGRDRVEAGSNEPIAFPIECNDVLLVDGVEAVFRTSDLPGEWTLAPSGNVGTNTRPGGGEWESRDGDWVWTKDRMARAEQQTPEITFAVPDGIESGEYAVPIELSAVDGGEGGRHTVAESEATLQVGQTLVDAAVTTPEEPLLPDQPADITVEVQLLGDAVRDPQVRVEGFPRDIVAEEASASDGGDGRVEAGGAVWTWSGERGPGETFEATLTVTLRRGADESGGSVGFAGRATVESIATGETQTDEFTGRLAVSGLSSFTSEKRKIAGRLDEISIGGIGEVEAVQPILAEIVDAVERERAGESGVTLTETEAEQAVERLVLGETPARYCFELMGPAEPPQPYLTDGSIARRTASRGLSVGFALATLALGSGKLATAVGRATPKVARLEPAVRQFVKQVNRLIDEVVSLGGRLKGRSKDVSSNVIETVLTQAGLKARNILELGSDELAAVTDDVRDGIIETLVQGDLQAGLDGLHTTVTAANAASGLPGSIEGARDARSDGIGTMEGKYETADSVLNDLEDTWIVDAAEIATNFGGIWLNLAEAVYNAITFDPAKVAGSLFDAVFSLLASLKSVFETVTKFFTGGSPATVMGGVSIRQITGTARGTIDDVAEGGSGGGA